MDIIPSGNFNQELIQLSKNISHGVWLPNLNRVMLIKLRGKFVHTMGYSSDYDVKSEPTDEKSSKSEFLYPEEALYLTENLNLIIYLKTADRTFQLPMSIEQCYEKFFNYKYSNEFDVKNDHSRLRINFNQYKIYSNSIKNGFIARRVDSYKQDETKKSNTLYSNERKKDNHEIEPIIQRSKHGQLSECHIFERLNCLVKNVNLNELKSKLRARVKKENSDFENIFDLHPADKHYKRSSSEQYGFRVTAQKTGSDNHMVWPRLADYIVNNSSSQGDNLYAFVDDGNEALYYKFKFDFCLPFVVKDKA